MTFGEDYLVYEWDKGKRSVIISPESIPSYNCDHALWESALKSLCPSTQSRFSGTPILSPSLSPKSAITLKGDLNIPQMPLATSTKTSSSSTAVIPSHCTDLRVCVNGNTTRGQLAMLNFPPVVQVKEDNIKLIVGGTRLTNPLVVGVRPCEATVSKCQQLLSQANNLEDDQDPDVAVQLGNLGVFDQHSLEIWRKAVIAADVKRKVTEEKRWLSNTRVLTDSQIQEVAGLLFDSKPQQEILRFGNIIVDANDLSSLVAERYLTGFIIDGACLKYCQEAQANGGQCIYLPSFTQTWAVSGNCNNLHSKVVPYISGRELNQLQWLITPIHINNNHWGLLCLNMVSCQAFFDDGLKVNPPLNICDIIWNLVEVITLLMSKQSLPPLPPSWNISLPIQRFGMPVQPLHGEGCGSCGMGVILAAKDFLNVGQTTIPHFNWLFKDMTDHRQRLLYQFVEWR